MLRVALGVVVTAMLLGAPAVALDGPALDPAQRPIAQFDNTLLDSMKQAKELGVAGRYEKLRPVIERTFDMPGMTSTAVGVQFASLPQSDQRALVEAFTRMTAATYAHEFSGYSGQSFSMEDKVLVRGDRKLVQTTLLSPGDKPHAFAYVMHRVGDEWKVTDILLEGFVSQMATKRSDFSATFATHGSQALISRLDTISDGLLSQREARS